MVSSHQVHARSPQGCREAQGLMMQGQDEDAGRPRGYLEQLNEIEMPEIEFTPRTKRERLIQQAYKSQRKINELQKKLINKLFRKVK